MVYSTVRSKRRRIILISNEGCAIFMNASSDQNGHCVDSRTRISKPAEIIGGSDGLTIKLGEKSIIKVKVSQSYIS